MTVLLKSLKDLKRITTKKEYFKIIEVLIKLNHGNSYIAFLTPQPTVIIYTENQVSQIKTGSQNEALANSRIDKYES